MNLYISTLAITIISSGATPRYVIDTYDSPLEEIHFAYPLDICVQYIKGIASTLDEYAIYSCNEDGTVVTRTEYGKDSTCSTSEGTKTFGDTTLTPGALNSFNCNGDDDYTVTLTYQYTDDDYEATCCEQDAATGPIIVTSATNICFQTADGTYSLSMCDADGIGSQYEYNDTNCETIVGDPIYEYDDECGYVSTRFSVDIWQRISDCVKDGAVIFENDLCDTIMPFTSILDVTTTETTTSNPPTTGDPTSDPTGNPIAEPTRVPTQDPTTDAPTTKVDKGVGEFYFVKHLILLVLVVATSMT